MRPGIVHICRVVDVIVWGHILRLARKDSHIFERLLRVLFFVPDTNIPSPIPSQNSLTMCEEIWAVSFTFYRYLKLSILTLVASK